MRGADLTYSEILEVARRLPPRQRSSLVQELVSAPEAKKIAHRLRPAFRLPAKKQKRLSCLLQKGNAGKLTSRERQEVDSLVEEVDSKMIEFAKAVDSSIKSARPNGRNGSVRR
jgi:hypothetical protein